MAARLPARGGIEGRTSRKDYVVSYDIVEKDPHILLHWLEALQHQIHRDNAKGWEDPYGQPLQRNKGEMIALMHSELSECLEGVRKSLPDTHLPQYSMELVELADTIIRIFDYAEGFGLGALGPVILNKMIYNRQREDHKHEARQLAHGKKF
jgi:hypothetical protein